MIRVFVFFFFLSVVIDVSAQRIPIPALANQRIHDQAGVLSANAFAQLTQQLQTYEDSTSNQMAILTLATLGDESLEEFSYRVAREWKLGQEARDNGILLLVVVQDRKVRIEVGKGLEGALTDAQSGRIIRNEIAPAFRKGNYDEGIRKGIIAIAKAAAGEFQVSEPELTKTDDGTDWFSAPIILFVLGSFAYNLLFTRGSLGWILYLFLIPFVWLFPPLVIPDRLAQIMLWGYIGGMPILRLIIQNTEWGKRKAREMEERQRHRKSGGGWSGRGGWFGGSSGGWSSGGGGFSGGGGSFGGGGASGSW
jgi:uncharacterized protein